MSTQARRVLTLPAVALAMAWRSYIRKLSTDPLVTKSVTAGLLSVASDAVAQRLAPDRGGYRTSRALHELLVGLVLRGPLVHALHTSLHAWWPDNDGSSAGTTISSSSSSSGGSSTESGRKKMAAVAAKTAIDQVLFAPLLTALYIISRALAADEPVGRAVRRAPGAAAPLVVAGWTVWVPANALAYAAIPVELRALFGNAVALVWNAYVNVRVSRSRR